MFQNENNQKIQVNLVLMIAINNLMMHHQKINKNRELQELNLIIKKYMKIKLKKLKEPVLSS